MSRTRRWLTRIVVSLALAAASASAGQQEAVPDDRAASFEVPVRTLIHYVNWFTGNNFRNATTLPANGLGEYVSTDPHVIAYHKSELIHGGKIPLISWWGKDDPRGDEFLDLFLSVPPRRHERELLVGLLYEAQGLLPETRDGRIDFHRHETRAKFVSDIIHLNDKYFQNPDYDGRFLQIEGKPVIFIWYSHAFFGPFEKVVADARRHADFYLIGSNFTLHGNLLEEWKSFIPAFDAISAYGAYDPELLERFGGANERYIAQYFVGAALWSDYLAEHSPQTELILPMSFAFDNSKSEKRSLDFYMDAFEAGYFASRVRTAIDCSLAGNRLFRQVVPTVLFVSFNEHFEGTALEPSVHYRDGRRPYFLYGDIFRQVFQRPIGPRSHIDPARCEALLY